MLAALGGGCQVPIGAHATLHGATIHLRAIIVSPDGVQVIRKQSSGPAENAAAIGRTLGEDLLSEGGAQILEAVYGA